MAAGAGLAAQEHQPARFVRPGRAHHKRAAERLDDIGDEFILPDDPGAHPGGQAVEPGARAVRRGGRGGRLRLRAVQKPVAAQAAGQFAAHAAHAFGGRARGFLHGVQRFGGRGLAFLPGGQRVQLRLHLFQAAARVLAFPGGAALAAHQPLYPGVVLLFNAHRCFPRLPS